jgi:hypothetical protein
MSEGFSFFFWMAAKLSNQYYKIVEIANKKNNPHNHKPRNIMYEGSHFFWMYIAIPWH